MAEKKTVSSDKITAVKVEETKKAVPKKTNSTKKTNTSKKEYTN